MLQKNCRSFLMPTFYATNHQTVSINNCRKIFCLNSNKKMLWTPPMFWMRDADECSDFLHFFLIYFQYKKSFSFSKLL
jgi:hypothetical protein